ncbi:glycine cleavage system aminomethyltransferase GcvT [Clostridiisalibacter paucivorans]|uniref:glycine cleavage system aminomethyltransferase GcvT n=1 Tax=Clostridiisalibacter paucivorans TaxID=408753 RepID=UPI00047E4A43|nr:glycine cleavage system aminomethyltransferase GcvT [Clostridiisalibacter paucivorans]
MDNLKKTALFEVYDDFGAKVVDYSGWALPVEFEGIIPEHESVRKDAGIFDVSHMGEIEVKGEKSEDFIQYIATNDISKLKDNQVMYSFMCYPDGGIVDDLLIYKFSSKHFLLVVNASNTEKDYQWLVENNIYDVDIDNTSSQYAQFAVQGPKAQKILQRMTDYDLSSIKFFFSKKDIYIDGVNVLISRTGYTGEDGFEIYLSPNDAPKLWKSILSQGKVDGIKPIGLGARDTLRFEASLPLYGNEISKEITPLEAGFGFFVKLGKENFIGKDKLVKEKAEGSNRKLIGFEMLDRGIPRHGYPVIYKDEEIGVVTTGYYSPTLKKNIGLALIKSNTVNMDGEIQIAIRKKTKRAKVISKKFYTKNYKK